MNKEPNATVRKATQLVAFVNGSWAFYDLGLLSFKESRSGSKWAIPGFNFGIVNEFDTNPSNVMLVGKPQDYLFLSPDGRLTVISEVLAKYYV